MEDIQWGKTTEDLAISISTYKPVYKPDEIIMLNFVLKNTGKAPVPIVIRSTWIDYALSVRFNDTEITKTPYALRMIDSAMEGRRMTRQLMPEEIVTDTLELNNVYNMKVPGVYKVVATRQTYKKGKLDEYATVTSNELAIQIAGPDEHK